MAPVDGGPGLLFAAAIGAVEKHREDHLVLDLPLGPDVRAEVDPAYDVVTWRGRCPDEHREAYLAMRNQMNADVPTGELDLEPTVLDDARLASSEERLMRSYDVRVAAARRRSTAPSAATRCCSSRTEPTSRWQDDTLVMPEHRGHRLGAALKAVNYAEPAGRHRPRPHVDGPVQHRDAPHQHRAGLPRGGAHARDGGRRRPAHPR